jgi:hypothetical protein
MQIAIASTLAPRYRRSVERLVFFNREQGRRREDIVRALAVYGQPRILADPPGLSVCLDGPHSTQCLFALTERMGQRVVCGVVVYARPSEQEVVIVHVAVRNPVARGARSAVAVLLRLIRQVRNVARHLRGTEHLHFPYTGRRCLGIDRGPDRKPQAPPRIVRDRHFLPSPDRLVGVLSPAPVPPSKRTRRGLPTGVGP